MAIKLTYWSEEEASKEIRKRFTAASSSRKRLEEQWIRNEVTVYGSNFNSSAVVMDLMGDSTDLESTDSHDINVAYTFKNLRFIHSQLSANPPSVAMRPTSSDQEDVRKADAADRVVRYMIRKYQMQEQIDLLTLGTCIYGTAVLKTVWDADRGDILEFDKDSGELIMEGDISVAIPHTRNIFLDPDAHAVAQIKWVIERIYMDFDEAVAKWPDKIEQLKAARKERSDLPQSASPYGGDQQEQFNSVELLEYWETGLPSNGYMGKYCILISTGPVLEPCRPNPFRFARAGTMSKLLNSDLAEEVIEVRMQRLPQMAQLPYHILTDIDVVNSVWGKSFLEYAAPLQEALAQIDSAYMDNIRANGVARMVISDASEVDIDISNSPWDVTKVAGNQAPYFMEVPNLMPEMSSSRQNMITGINDVAGVNEAMFGQQSREQSGASMQYATNQGNMIRRRLFNKYVLVVENIYKSMLNLARKHWSEDRTIAVLGNEKAFEAISLKGADIDGGYDVVGEYGVTLSLDPITRRQEILQLQPMFEKAGIPPRMSMKMLKLNELEGMYDKLEMAEDRQREIFEEQAASHKLIPPEEYQDHTNMIAWALDWFMTAEFKYLGTEARELAKAHIKARIQQEAVEKSGGLSGQPQAPGPAGAMGTTPLEGPQEPISGAPETPAIVNG